MTALGTPPSSLSDSALTITSNTFICHVKCLKYIYIYTFDLLVLFVNIDLSAAVLAVGPANCSHLAATVQRGVWGCQWLSSHCSHL